MGVEKYEVSADKLEWHCDPALFAFDCTQDLAPLRDLRNLMLRQEVTEVVKQGKFHVYAVSSVGEGIEVGSKKEDGTYPEGSINYKVDEKLKDMAAKLRQFAAPPAKEKKSEGS
ncbi:MAG: hypothetical protein MUO89_01745 [Dehalococcoidia bacterium]|nr:hypothetical protein [Dehalococcoidia bacterium]